LPGVREFPPLPYKQKGVDPDPGRPLRSEPVRREEVLITECDWRLLTMPIGTFRLEERPTTWGIGHQLVGDAALWQSLLDELAVALAAEIESRRRSREELLRQDPSFARFMSNRPPPVCPKPEFYVGSGNWRPREYVCEHCARRYLGGALRGNHRVCVCSNRCAHARRNAQQRRWRDEIGCWNDNVKRTARRAEARAGRACEHCGVPIAAARSTKRFCSAICRVRHHREAAQ
jgi:hypothetical protein